MPRFETDVDIDIDGFLSHCSNGEIKELIEWLVEDGHIPPYVIRTEDSGFTDDMWQEQISKLFHNRWKLTVEDEQTVLSVAKKLV